MSYIVFDIETKNSWSGPMPNPIELDLSIICIYDSTTDLYYSFLENELHKLWPFLEKTEMLVGYNSDHFDIPILNKYYHGDLTQVKSIDLMASIQDSLGKRLKLDDVASATVNAKKTANGLIAVKWWREGNIADIKKY